MTHKEVWTAVHGMVFGAAFLLLFSGVIAALWGLRRNWLTEIGIRHRLRLLNAGSWALAIFAWLTVIVGTYAVYPWYRAKPPVGITPAHLHEYPRSLLLSDSSTAEWHNFGMECKEHIGWLVPLLATAVAAVVTRHGRSLPENAPLRHALLMLLIAALFCAAVAGGLGALINKAAPVR